MPMLNTGTPRRKVCCGLVHLSGSPRERGGLGFRRPERISSQRSGWLLWTPDDMSVFGSMKRAAVTFWAQDSSCYVERAPSLAYAQEDHMVS